MASRGRPSFKDTLRANDAAARGYEAMYGDLRVAKGAGEHPMNNVPDAKVRGPAKNPTPANDLEGAVADEVEAMLLDHPLVAFAIRQNSGGTKFTGERGKEYHVAFARFVKRPAIEGGKTVMRIPDYWGMLTNGRLYVIETKERGWHITPSDKRAHQQLTFMRGVIAHGGRAGFATCAEIAQKIIEGTR